MKGNGGKGGDRSELRGKGRKREKWGHSGRSILMRGDGGRG